jgi:hypothetical protein
MNVGSLRRGIWGAPWRRSWLCIRVIWVTCVLLVAVAPSAYAAPHLKLIGKSVTWLYTDGARWAAYEPSAGITRLIDSKARRSSNRPDPTGCTGGLVAVGSGELLYHCEQQCPPSPTSDGACVFNKGSGQYNWYQDTRYVAEDIATGLSHPIIGDNHLPMANIDEGGSTSLVAVGRQWVEGIVTIYHGGGRYWLNWHTGRLVEEDASMRFDAGKVMDLNSSSLVRPICTPLARATPNSNGVNLEVSDFPSFAYVSPFAFESPEEREEAHGHLRRCGSRQTQTLPGVAPWSLQLGGGVLSWIASDPRIRNNDDTMYLTRLDRHARSWHRRIYTLDGPEVGRHFMLLQHTATTVYETTARPGSLRVYAAWIP